MGLVIELGVISSMQILLEYHKLVYLEMRTIIQQRILVA